MLNKLKCVNESCGSSLNGECAKQMVNDLGYCSAKIEPTHTPTYAEEQLNHVLEKENNTPVAPIDYEEEYHKLKKENEELKDRLNNQGKRIKTDGNQIQKLFVEIDSLKLKAAVTEKLEIEINNLNEIIERKDKEIHDLQISHNIIEQENNQLKFNAEELGQMVDEGEEEIKQLKTRIENRQVAIKSLSEGKQKLKEKKRRVLHK